MTAKQDVAWTAEDQQRIDTYAVKALEAARNSGLDLMQFAFGELQAVGLLIAEDLQQHPERLKIYASAIARLSD